MAPLEGDIHGFTASWGVSLPKLCPGQTAPRNLHAFPSLDFPAALCCARPTGFQFQGRAFPLFLSALFTIHPHP